MYHASFTVVERRYIEKEIAEQLRQSRLFPRKMPSTSNQQCIDWMAEVWSDRNLHAQARKGYKLIGATNALDGSEDHLIAREARLFWDKLTISAKRDATIRDVETEVEAGRLDWGYDAVYSLILPFPSRQELDETVELQDDEAAAPTDGRTFGSTTTSLTATMPKKMMVRTPQATSTIVESLPRRPPRLRSRTSMRRR